MTVSTVRSQEKTGSARHPLAPLAVAEAGIAARAALEASGPGSRLVYCALAEPAKAAVRGWDDGQPVPREVLCVVYERPKKLTWLVTVALDEPTRVTSAVPVPGAMPLVTGDEFFADSERIKQAPAFQAALARRGLTDMSAIHVDAWPASNFGLDVDKLGRPLARAVAYALDGPHPNPYARPIENLVVVWDRDAGEIVELQDGDPVPLPADPGRYDAASNTPHRELAELQILQPHGPGFTVDDGQLRWGPWQLRVSLHPVEGLVLHEVTYVDGERPRPILYRASMSEMVVPYGVHRRPTTGGRTPSTPASGGSGMTPVAGAGLRLPGRDPSTSTPCWPTRSGSRASLQRHLPARRGLRHLWKHVDTRTGSRRGAPQSRRMVVSSISTVGNYEYGFFWYFYLDGTIQARGEAHRDHADPGGAARASGCRYGNP